MAPPSGTNEGVQGEPQFLFVYGTLRRGFDSRMAHWLQRHAIHRGPAHVRGLLYEVNGYPGLVESHRRAERIAGDLYELPDAERVLTTLDEYEECSERFHEPREYRRELLPIQAGHELLAWVYIYNRSVSRLTRIEGGDYLAFTRQAEAANTKRVR